MTKITPFSIPVLEELLKRKGMRVSFVTAFPESAQYLGEKGITDRKALLASLDGKWVRWVESVWAEIEDLASIVSQFGPLADDYKERLAQYAPDVDKDAVQKQIDQKRNQMEVNGPKIWKWLHGMAIEWDGTAESLNGILSLITNAVPCGECKRHWVEMLTAHPPKATNASELFEETVIWHNRVNARLGKPDFSLGDALALYAKPELTGPKG